MKTITLFTSILSLTSTLNALEFKNSTDNNLYIQLMESTPKTSGVSAPQWHEVENITINPRKYNISWMPTKHSPNKIYGLCVRIGDVNGRVVAKSVQGSIPMYQVPGCSAIIMVNPYQQTSINAKYDIMGPLSAGNYYIAQE